MIKIKAMRSKRLRARIARLLRATDVFGVEKNVTISEVGENFRVVFRWYIQARDTELMERVNELHKNLFKSADRDVVALQKGLDITLNKVVGTRISCDNGLVLSYADEAIVEKMSTPEIIHICESIGFNNISLKEPVEVV